MIGGGIRPRALWQSESTQEEPTHEELWGVERLEEHARQLAQRVGSEPDTTRVGLEARLRSDIQQLERAYLAVVAALRAGRAITPASEWLVDNFHVIAEQALDIPQRLTPRVWRALPAAQLDGCAGWPRIFCVVREYLAHTDCDFNAESFSRYLLSYQSVTPLTMRELWSLYPVLRMALIDELRRLSVKMEAALAARGAADDFANTLLALGSPQQLLADPAELTLRASPYQHPFVVQLAHRLQSMGEERQPVLDQLARQLATQGTTIDEVVQREHARRSASNLTVRNVMTSLRALAAFDWRLLFERTSHVELLLRQEVSYGNCDRRTRDRYRECIEELARALRLSETEIAARVLQRLATVWEGAVINRSDIGDLLIGARRAELEAALGILPTLSQRLKRWTVRNARVLYCGGVVALSGVMVALAMRWGMRASGFPPPGAWLLALLGAFPASELVIGFVNRIWMWRFRPRHLPRLVLGQGLTAELKTLVVMPVILRTTTDAAIMTRELEVHALANPDPYARFALLSDWADSATEVQEDDASILEAAARAVEALNQRDPHPPADEPRFYLFHRRRQWNQGERCFMGWERKRGKLVELNRLLLGAGSGSFVLAPGTGVAPQGVRYVLTLDADTRLPLGAVRDLVGVAAHPLNRPVIDPALQRVVAGYGILQPRITPLLPTRDERSLYRDIITGGSGLDPYAAAVSDLFQDVFSEGLFTGKGLYDVAAFEAALAGRVPDNTLLSHDLFEGLFVRCALVTDIELFEDFPSHSEVAAARAHRWTRGDWQLLPWVLGRHGRLPPLGRWKILDNLRRSLLAPAAISLLIAAWSQPAARPAVWLGLVLLPWLWPALMTLLERAAIRPATQSIHNHARQLAADFAEDVARAAVALGMLAQNAWLSLDAIGRALVRVTITRRKRLEWVTAAEAKERSSDALSGFIWSLKSASIVALLTASCILWLDPPRLVVAAPLLLVWWLSPLLARFLSQPDSRLHPDSLLSPTVSIELRRIARVTWRFFEQFVTAEDHHLPPDNFQETPTPVVAHRSSPTNFGLYLLANIAARDFGWLGLNDLLARLSATMDSMEGLERFNGHLLNWYDTRTLAPLEPRYVSTVDSGNLAGHLITLRQALAELERRPLLAPNAFTGPLDALGVCRDVLAVLAESFQGTNVNVAELQGCLAHLRLLLIEQPSNLALALQRLRLARQHADRIEDMAQAFSVGEGDKHAAVAAWTRLLGNDIASHVRDLESMLPALPADLAGDVREHCADSATRLACSSSLPDILQHHTQLLEKLRHWPASGWSSAEQAAHRKLLNDLEQNLNRGDALLRLIGALGERCSTLAGSMQFGFLFDRNRGLFSIGFRIAENALDPGYYDLLASEARLASLVAIAKGDIPRTHWFKLGRRLTGGSHRPVLASWSGSMFEYLMPALVMREPGNSLLDQSNRNAVTHQIEFGAAQGLPWGVSESAYNVRDRAFTYQYSAFGLPSLGLKRGLGADHVVAPYATALAAMYVPQEAHRNFREMAALNSRGPYGYYDAIDFTARRIPDESRAVTVRTFMAHHQGMSLLAIDNAVNDRIMQDRFHAEPMIQAAELLLQERAVRFADAPTMIETEIPPSEPYSAEPDIERRVSGVAVRAPVTHLLSNRNYSVMLTDSGAGYSLCRSRAVTRWRADATQDAWGSFVYLRDVATGRYWSAGYQPTAAVPDEYEVIYKEERVEITRRDGSLTTTLEVIVTAEDDGELRRVSLRNDGSRVRVIDLTSYAEVVLAPQNADVAHPGFSNLFVQTEFVPDTGALLATRRVRSSAEAPVWAVHVLNTSSGGSSHLEYETDRMKFLGRDRNARAPLVIESGRPLSNSVGSVLDPIFSLRTRVSIAPGKTVSVTFATLVADSREQALLLASKYRHPAIFEHVTDFAWTFVRADLHHLQSDLVEAGVFQTLAANLLFPNRQLRTASDVVTANRLDISHLWRLSISGDRPILLIRCHSLEEQGFIRQCLRAQEYLRIKRLFIDVVVLNELQHSYIQDLQLGIERTIRVYSAMAPAVEGDERGGVYALRTDSLSPDERTLLLATARVVLQPAQGSLAEQLQRPAGDMATELRPFWSAPNEDHATDQQAAADSAPEREFFNGLGGFAAGGREYVITLEPGKTTPAPWSNVIANEHFGSLITESGSMCTWSLNSRENQLTPWSNDPVTDPTGEAFFIHDADSGQLWSPTPLPIRLPDARYEVHHGQGYSDFLLKTYGMASELRVFVTKDDPVKVSRLRLTNHSAQFRRLTIAVYIEWSLGPARAASAPSIVTVIDAATGAMFARNAALMDFGTRVAFCDLGSRQQHWTGSRREFLGRNGQLSAPAGMQDAAAWSRRVGAGFDPCCAFAVDIDLGPGISDEIVFVLGQAESDVAARELVLRYRNINLDESFQQLEKHWDAVLGAVQISTPDRSLDLLFNRWLLYQTLTCRMWGRAGFYQAGGAYGFRDQLQDAMALTLSAPALTRAHLLRAASRQFVEGDVQHWWHPPSGRGVRTHFSDDRGWLPFAVSQYLDVTQDLGVLDEPVPFIEGPALPAEREDVQFVPTVSTQVGSLYEHCVRAIEVSLRVGAHNLPLMGGGDWNDGMNRVGHEGRGESVWLAWFLIVNLRQFSAIAERRGDPARAQRWRNHIKLLTEACELHAWDGAWYRRAFFDDGSPLGSAANMECRIDSLSQSWAVLSGAADPQRAARSMDSVEEYLVRSGDGLVLLFTPPFDISPKDPGYVKGYLPGLRENGAQYTHAAIWVLMAQAALGDRAQVGALLDMLNPVRRSESRSGVQAYRVEPYVIAADVYSTAPNSRRGGWTWYTGASGWFYRAILESVLGVKVRGETLTVTPCMPPQWPGFEVTLVLPGIDYLIRVVRTERHEELGIELDGTRCDSGIVPLRRDGVRHIMRVVVE